MGDELERLRRIAATTDFSPAAADYLDKVRNRAFTITDGDVRALLDAGLSEDAIFEQTVGAAIAEGLRRLDAANEVIE